MKDLTMAASRILLATICTLTLSSQDVLSEGLRDGLYRVSVMLDMGQTEDLNARKTIEMCVRADAPGGVYGFFLLTKNIQLAHCPVKNVVGDGKELTFDIICDGIDAGRASAIYTLESNVFEGRYLLRMGGKNMTMRETQSGYRIGDCPK
jgi:hypothetical protein